MSKVIKGTVLPGPTSDDLFADIKDYLEKVKSGFETFHPNDDFQRGYLSAIEAILDYINRTNYQ